jgi:tyrosinase
MRHVAVSGVSRATIPGSFTVSAYAVIDGKRLHLGTEAVLSRWHVSGCANCQTHLETKAFIGMPGVEDKTVEEAHIEVEVRTHDGLLGQQHMLAAGAATRKPFRFEVR